MELAREWYREQKTKKGCKWIRQINEDRVHWWLTNVMTQMQILVQYNTALSPARSSEVKPGEGSLSSWSLSNHLLRDQTFVLTPYDYSCRALFTKAPCWTNLWLQQWPVKLRETCSRQLGKTNVFLVHLNSWYGDPKLKTVWEKIHI